MFSSTTDARFQGGTQNAPTHTPHIKNIYIKNKEHTALEAGYSRTYCGIMNKQPKALCYCYPLLLERNCSRTFVLASRVLLTKLVLSGRGRSSPTPACHLFFSWKGKDEAEAACLLALACFVPCILANIKRCFAHGDSIKPVTW
jgi:hypothetical protein